MENFEKKVENYINQYKMLDGVSHVVVGVSGGADSVCLLTLLYQLSEKYNIHIYALHVNHMIRGAEADADENYVAKLCDKMNIGLKVVRKDVCAIAKKEKLTVEEAGRNVRYHAFSEFCQELSETAACKKAVIAVAHNENDAAETVILNMLRGSGADGIKGIPPMRGNIIRPLLCVKRQEIEAYLAKNDMYYCMDSTNNDTEYTRNKIRHDILPAMEKINDRAIEHITKLAARIGEYTEYTDSQVELFIKQHVSCFSDESDTGRWIVSMDVLRAENPLIEGLVIKELIAKVCGGSKDIGSSHVDEVRKLYNTKSGAMIMLPHGAVVRHQYGKLEFAMQKASEETTAVGENELNDKVVWQQQIDMDKDGVYMLDNGRGQLSIRIYDRPEILDLSKKEYTKLLDYDKIRNNILLRNYSENDYMTIGADGSKKKMNRLFGSCKIPVSQRKNVILVADGSEIVWAIGIRIGERYKIAEDTKRIMEMEYRKL
ncbi:MAG: tRNA lysidine(34) synthetase TilS [Coprococcus sp.]|nr:tRNA lysidine(34) synthetase TilS [Coprococcus sp.]